MEAMAVLDPRPCWRGAGSQLLGKEVPLEQECVQETEHGILTRAALSGTMLPGSNVPLDTSQGEAGRQQPATARGRGQETRHLALSVQSLNSCYIFFPNLIKKRKNSP